MTVAEKLKTARADLAALERHTAKLEGNVSAQTAELDRIRREARSGSAEFESVVEQQNRVTAAEGLLSMHLQDVANTAALVDELQAAQSAEDLIDEGRSAQAEAVRLGDEYAQKAQDTEALIQTALTDLQALQRAYSAALARSLSAATRYTGAALNLSHQDVMNAVLRPHDGLKGPEGAAQRERVQNGLDDFAANIGTSPAALHALMRRNVPELIAQGHYPLLGRVNRA